MGQSGTSSYIHVGRFDISYASQRKSAKASWTPLESVTLLPLTWKSSSQICLHRPLDLGRSSVIERSSPRTWYHLCTPILRWEWGMADMIASNRATQCDRRVIIMLMESTIHLSRVCHVDQEHSLASIFFSKRTSLRCLVSCFLRGRNSLSKAWKSLRRTWRRRCHVSCPSPTK